MLEILLYIITCIILYLYFLYYIFITIYSDTIFVLDIKIYQWNKKLILYYIYYDYYIHFDYILLLYIVIEYADGEEYAVDTIAMNGIYNYN